jgi:fatty acid desaturase
VFWKPALKKKNYAFVFGMVLYLAGAGFVLGPWAMAGGLLAYLYMVEVINFPHHLGVVQYGGERRFPVYDQLQFARSCVYPKWFAHNVLLNFNLHAEHHLLPSYPWYQLDEIHALLSENGHLPNASRGNEWILRQRRRPVEEVFAETFTRDAGKKAA